MDPLHLEGSISVLAALEAGVRRIHAVYLQAGKEIRDVARIRAATKQRQLELNLVPGVELDALAQSHSHGGVLALAAARTYLPLEELASDQPNPFIAMLYGVEDPYNFGQAIRALYAAGAHGLVVPARNWDSTLSVVTRASAGASEHMPTAQVSKLEEAITHFKGRGFTVASTAKDPKSVSLYATDLHGPLFVLIGGERRGLNAAALAACDLHLTIPYGRAFHGDLDVTSSTAALAFEVMRQRVWAATHKP
ncbi:MAG: RNA methyltransferase [Anaerolineales bacterium]